MVVNMMWFENGGIQLENDDLLKIMQRRRSVRQYCDVKKVIPEELLKLIEAARWAPSANNRQCWKFVSVTQAELIQNIAAETEKIITGLLCQNSQFKADNSQRNYLHNFLFFKDAPVVIFVLARKINGFLETTSANAGLTQQATLLSVGAAIQNLLLVAETMNLHTCWMTGPLLARSRIEELLGVAVPWELVSMIPVGKGTDRAAGAGILRKPIEKIWERLEDAATN
jgi:nitroreductase